MQSHFVDELKMPVVIQTWELPPGGSEGMHSHDAGETALEEFYLVLQGSAHMQVGAEHYELHPGDSVLAPVGVEHDLRNAGEDVLRVLTVWGPPGEADFSAYGSIATARELRTKNR